MSKEKFYDVRVADTIRDIVNDGAELYAENPAFLTKKEKGGAYIEISYQKLKDDVDALGACLIDMGLKDEKIAVIGANCYQWIAAYMAIVNGVGTVVPLDKELSRAEINNLIDTADCKAAFYTEDYETIFDDSSIERKFKMSQYESDKDKDVPNHIRQMMEEGRKLLGAGDRRYVDASLDPDESKMILFTSGTTDKPKGVMLSHRNIAESAMAVSKIVRLKENDVSLSILPIHHTFESTIDIMVMLFQGKTVAFFEGLKYVVKNMQESKASILVGVPLILESLYDKIWKQAKKTGRDKKLRTAIRLNRTLKAMGIDKSRSIFKSVYKNFGGNLRFIISGAAALDPNAVRGFIDLGLEVSQGYGLTETSPLISGVPDYEDIYKKAGSVGPVVPGGEIKIVDPDKEGIGEIIYRGPNVMQGYYKMPEKTAEVIKDGWFYTGDLGFVDDKGWLYITGRKKNIIVTKTGKNIYPEELETLINADEFVEESMVYGMEDEVSGDIIVACQIRADHDAIKEKHGEVQTDESIYELLRESVFRINRELPSYKRIRDIIIRKDEFVKTTTKKIRRQDNL